MALTVENLRTKQWDKSNLWDITLEGMEFADPSRWIPVNDMEIAFQGIENGTLGETGVEFAQKTTSPTLTLSYIDDENLTMTHALRTWQSYIISHDGVWVKPMNSAGVLKRLVINKLNSKKETTTTINTFVYPTGAISYHGDSDGSTPIYSVTFVVAKMGIKKSTKETFWEREKRFEAEPF